MSGARVALCGLLLACAACVQQRGEPTQHQVSSLLLALKTPDSMHLGTPQQPVSAQTATFDITAVDGSGAVFGGDLDVQVFLSFGGVKVGGANACLGDANPNLPLDTVHLTAGRLTDYHVDLPRAFGPTSIWIEELEFHAVGASPTIYFRNAHIDDIQTPPDITADNASFCTPFDRKFVIVDQAINGGQLVVSSVFGNAFAVTDTGSHDYAHFNSIYLFAFGKPPSYIVPGKVVRSFSGNVSKFVGFTELNFPLFDIRAEDPADELLLPPPAVLTSADITNLPKLLAMAAGVVQLTAKECNPLDPAQADQWNKFNSFVVGDTSCDSLSNFAVQLPAKMLGPFDPLANAGRTLQVTGMLKNNSGQNLLPGADGKAISCSDANPCARGNCVEGECRKNPFNFWTILPRTPDDIVVK